MTFQSIERKQFAIPVSPKVFEAVGKRAREQGDVKAIARATGVKPDLVERILAAWRHRKTA